MPALIHRPPLALVIPVVSTVVMRLSRGAPLKSTRPVPVMVNLVAAVVKSQEERLGLSSTAVAAAFTVTDVELAGAMIAERTLVPAPVTLITVEVTPAPAKFTIGPLNGKVPFTPPEIFRVATSAVAA